MSAKPDHQSIAVVIGASVSGLLAAKVLSDISSRVVIIEKDAIANACSTEPGAMQRKGLPQASHQHLLLVKGRQLFEDFFPGFDQELERHGAPLVNYSEDVSLFVGEGKLPRFASGLDLRVCRRPLIDHLIRERLHNIENIEFVYEAQVRSFSYDQNKTRVTGVTIENKGKQGVTQIESDLVVDCSGRASRTASWLAKEGFSDVPKIRVNPKLAYASQLFELKGSATTDLKAIEVAPHAPDKPRAAGFWPVEGNKWLLTLIGLNAQYPGATQDQFDAFVSELPADLSRALRPLTPVSDIAQFRGTENIWKRYDRMTDYPAGLLVMGDAMCAFNPLYGQGLTLIAMAARDLKKQLPKGMKTKFSANWSKSCYRRFNRFFNTAWMIAISEDMRWPETEGRNVTWYLNLSYRYMDRLLDACVYSTSLASLCLSIANMLRSPLNLIRPDVVLKAIWYGRKRHIDKVSKRVSL